MTSEPRTSTKVSAYDRTPGSPAWSSSNAFRVTRRHARRPVRHSFGPTRTPWSGSRAYVSGHICRSFPFPRCARRRASSVPRSAGRYCIGGGERIRPIGGSFFLSPCIFPGGPKASPYRTHFWSGSISEARLRPPSRASTRSSRPHTCFRSRTRAFCFECHPVTAGSVRSSSSRNSQTNLPCSSFRVSSSSDIAAERVR